MRRVREGVTFDSGGISIKPAQSMEDMKYDMSGAAAVLGAFEVVGLLKPKVNVVGLIPATENLPSGTAVEARGGGKSPLRQTHQVLQTRGRGRALPCGAPSYARGLQPAGGSGRP